MSKLIDGMSRTKKARLNRRASCLTKTVQGLRGAVLSYRRSILPRAATRNEVQRLVVDYIFAALTEDESDDEYMRFSGSLRFADLSALERVLATVDAAAARQFCDGLGQLRRFPYGLAFIGYASSTLCDAGKRDIFQLYFAGAAQTFPKAKPHAINASHGLDGLIASANALCMLARASSRKRRGHSK